MNEENLKKEDLLLSRVKDLKEGFTREEILSLLKDGWKNFGYTGEVRYGRNSARDCSRFMMDLFSTFGILIPRNSKLQARVGISLGQLEGKTMKEKKKILDRAIPLATTLRLPGHIMLYLGRENGRYYVIHNIWGIQKAGWFGPSVKKIGKTVVSDLSLGKSGPEASLLDRTTDIRTLGPSSGPSKRINE